MSTTPNTLPPLPQGYQLQGGQGLPPLPPGYQLQKDDTGILAGIGRGLKGVFYDAPKAAYQAFTTPTTEAEKQAVVAPIPPGDRSPLYSVLGPETPIGQWARQKIAQQGLSSTGNLINRTIIQPGQAQQAQAQEAAAQGRTSEAVGHSVAAALPGAGPFAAQLGERAGRGDVSGALAEGATVLALPHVIGKVPGIVKGVPEATTAVRRIIAKPTAPLLPKIVQIEGVDMPVLAGEATPASVPGTRIDAAAGRLQTSLKSQGIRSGKFQEIAAKQQAATKQVIQNVAAKTSGMTDVTPTAEPGPAMQSAADATFAKARPMYQALDASLTTVPETADAVSQIVKQAQSRAAKLGATFTDTSETAAQEATYQKAVSDYRLEGDAALKLRTSMGLPETPAETAQPLESVLKTRSELLKMARASSDPATQRAIYQEVDSMNAAVEKSLAASKTPGLVENWQQANRLWTKGYALERVSESLQRAVRGTPVESQVPGIQPQLPHVSGARLVQELNKLDSRGDLFKAFSPAQRQALRNVADLLDRSQKTRIGQTTLVKGGYSPHSMAWHTVTDIIKSVGSAPFVKIMTSESGARLMNRVIQAQTPEAAATAGSALKSQAGIPQYAYRSRSIGEQGISAGKSHAQAGLDEARVREYMPGRESVTGQPQEIVKVNLSKLPTGSHTVHPNGFVQFHTDVPESAVEPHPAPSVANGKVTDAHVRQENAFYTQARTELGANAPVSQVLQRAQQLKQQGVQMPTPPPSIVHRAVANAHPLTGAQRAAATAAIMSQLKSGEITQQDADRKIQKITGGGGRKLVRMPQAP